MKKIEENHYLADEGKMFVKRSNGAIVGDELFLGFSYYDDFGNKLETPHLDTIGDFDEVEQVVEPWREHGSEDIGDF